MPSLFSRTRTTSTPDNENDLERRHARRVDSRGSARQAIQRQFAIRTKAPSRKDPKAPANTYSPGADDDDGNVGLPDGSFLP